MRVTHPALEMRDPFAAVGLSEQKTTLLEVLIEVRHRPTALVFPVVSLWRVPINPEVVWLDDRWRDDLVGDHVRCIGPAIDHLDLGDLTPLRLREPGNLTNNVRGGRRRRRRRRRFLLHGLLPRLGRRLRLLLHLLRLLGRRGGSLLLGLLARRQARCRSVVQAEQAFGDVVSWTLARLALTP